MIPSLRLSRHAPVTFMNVSRTSSTRLPLTPQTRIRSTSRPNYSCGVSICSPQNVPSPPNRVQIASMSTMQATHGHNQACCNIPPVVSSSYVPKGLYEKLGGIKTYVTGPEEATKGIVAVFDIFSYFNQTLQGADILATSDDHQKYKVFMPDWFNGSPCPAEWYPPDTEQKQKQLGEWFGRNMPQGPAATLPRYVATLTAANPSIDSWGLIGYCWGGKVAEIVTTSEGNPFKVAAAFHPAMIDPSGAEKIPVPYILLASGEDPVEDVKKFESYLKVPNHVEVFGDQVHGWMAARADLSNPRVQEEYSRGYKTVLEFFGKLWEA